MLKNIQRVINAVLDVVLPPRCIISGDIVDAQGMVAPSAWVNLNFITPPYCAQCGYPFELVADSSALCAACLKDAPLYDRARHVFRYDDFSSALILKFKYADQTHITRTLAGWMMRTGEELLKDTDLILPVPLHPRRLLWRRYNQAALLAQSLSKLTGTPALVGALQRRRATTAQGKGYKARHENVKGAFAVNPALAAQLAGKTILLVDDVYTSGATIRECTKVLKKAGVTAVNVVTLARTINPHNSY